MPKAAKKHKEDEGLCVANCPAFKDHVKHAIDHLHAVAKAPHSLKIRNQTVELEKMLRGVQNFAEGCFYHVNVAECLPEKKRKKRPV
jgi:hypothetical protein